MGLNRNRGQSIHLRLRTDDWNGLRPYEAVVQVRCMCGARAACVVHVLGTRAVHARHSHMRLRCSSTSSPTTVSTTMTKTSRCAAGPWSWTQPKLALLTLTLALALTSALTLTLTQALALALAPNGLQALNSELGREYRAHRDAHRGARSASDHAVAAAAPQEGDEELERASHPGYTLGEGAAAAEAAVAAAARPGYSYPLDVRAAAARAALRRATQGCVECVDDEPPGEQSR